MSARSSAPCTKGMPCSMPPTPLRHRPEGRRHRLAEASLRRSQRAPHRLRGRDQRRARCVLGDARDHALRLPAHRNVAGRTEFFPQGDAMPFGLRRVHFGQHLMRSSSAKRRVVNARSRSVMPVKVSRWLMERVKADRVHRTAGRLSWSACSTGCCSTREPFLGVQVLQVRESERFTHFMPDGQKQQATAFLTKAAHGGRVGRHGRKKKVGFPFAVFGVEDAHGFAPGEGGKRCIEACGHVPRLGLPFKKGRIGSLLPDSATL